MSLSEGHGTGNQPDFTKWSSYCRLFNEIMSASRPPVQVNVSVDVVTTFEQTRNLHQFSKEGSSYVTLLAPRPPVQETGNQSSSVAIQETGYESSDNFPVVTARNLPQFSEDDRITSYGTVSGFNNNIRIPELNLPGPCNMIGDSQPNATCSFQ